MIQFAVVQIYEQKVYQQTVHRKFSPTFGQFHFLLHFNSIQCAKIPQIITKHLRPYFMIAHFTEMACHILSHLYFPLYLSIEWNITIIQPMQWVVCDEPNNSEDCEYYISIVMNIFESFRVLLNMACPSVNSKLYTVLFHYKSYNGVTW